MIKDCLSCNSFGRNFSKKNSSLKTGFKLRHLMHVLNFRCESGFSCLQGFERKNVHHYLKLISIILTRKIVKFIGTHTFFALGKSRKFNTYIFTKGSENPLLSLEMRFTQRLMFTKRPRFLVL